MSQRERARTTRRLLSIGWDSDDIYSIRAFRPKSVYKQYLFTDDALEGLIHEIAHNAIASVREMKRPKTGSQTKDLVWRDGVGIRQADYEETLATAITINVMLMLGAPRLASWHTSALYGLRLNVSDHCRDYRPTTICGLEALVAKTTRTKRVQALMPRVFDYVTSVLY